MNESFIGFFLTDYVYEKNGELIRGSKGDMLIIPRGEVVYHGPTPEMTDGFINDWVYVSGEEFIEEAKALSIPIGTPFSVGGERLLKRFIEKAEKEKAYLGEGYERMISLFISELLIKIARAYRKSGDESLLPKLTELRVEMVNDPKRDWTLSEMAKRCGYSESHFSALYKATYGLSPMADLLNMRLENAKFLLLYSSKPISEIAFDVGFSTVFYFSSFFKRHIGISPKDYRERGADD
jgi:AraC-like DNA-binding protein